MEDYFKAKIGEVIKKKVHTNEFFTSVYARVYNVEVLKVTDGELTVEVVSHDETPTGKKDRDTVRERGELTVKIADKTKTAIIDEIIREADSKFFEFFKLIGKTGNE